MNVYKVNTVSELLSGNTYPGRGIMLGKTPDGKNAVSAYFIMGRSENSRNRVFTKKDEVIYTEPFDASKVIDPSLIIYAAVRSYENKLIVTNGDQTDTVFEGLKNSLDFDEALTSREFEPDSPNWTPRISGMITFGADNFSYQMSILKSLDEEGSDCARYTFSYPSKSGLGHFIHTYVCNGNPVIPTFQGEPERVEMMNDINEFAESIWNSLDSDNKISLYVRYTDVETKKYKDIIINKNK